MRVLSQECKATEWETCARASSFKSMREREMREREMRERERNRERERARTLVRETESESVGAERGGERELE